VVANLEVVLAAVQATHDDHTNAIGERLRSAADPESGNRVADAGLDATGWTDDEIATEDGQTDDLGRALRYSLRNVVDDGL
jgi:hypothetical protein